MAYCGRERECMSTPFSHARPPVGAEAIFRMLLKPEDRDSVSGDLLEEYRESIVPARGSGAYWWYLRQVGSFLVWASWFWAAVMGGALVVRYLLDTLAPVSDYRIGAT